MKLNLYSIFIFLIGLISTYMITKNVEKIEIRNKNQHVATQTQAITNTIQQQMSRHAQLLSLTAKRWPSIEQINNNWQQDVDALIIQLPHLSNINIYLLDIGTALTLGNNIPHYFAATTELTLQTKHLRALHNSTKVIPENGSLLSVHQIQANNQATSYLHSPIYINEILIGYLEATLNITALFDSQVAKYQLLTPFSLSEKGATIYNGLPSRLVPDIQQQVTVPMLGHNWQLIVAPLQKYQLHQYASYIGLLLSIVFTLLFYILVSYKKANRTLIVQQQRLTTINDDISASKSRLVQSNKLSSLGEIVAGITHEINQPLQVICIHADMCQESIQKNDYYKVEKNFQAIISQVARIERIVKQVGNFARNSELDSYVQEVPATIIDNVINIVINQYNQDNVELRQLMPASLPSLLCNKTQIEQVLVNLLINAKDAVENSNEKIVFIKAHDKQGKLHIEVSDTGCGIEISKLGDIFTPFYTTKALGSGTGLGLSISHSIIVQHSGELQVFSEVGKGSTFTVILPLG